MAHFITNDPDRNLSTRLQKLVEGARALDFLTAFFTFSAWPEVYEPLRKAYEAGQSPKLRLLVGLGVLESKGATNRALKEAFLELLARGLKDPSLDHLPDLPEQARFFLQLFGEGHLEIRKTREPNHAKLYLFHLKPELQGLFNRPGVFITGSSNFTHAGLRGQHEFNVEVMDYGFPEALAYFEVLWKEAVPLSPEDWILDRLTRAVERGSLAALPTPFETYALLIKRYVDLLRADPLGLDLEAFLKEVGYRSYRYQLDAVEAVVKILKTYGGAILADVVGLGKSVVASLVGRVWGRRGIVIAPPALLGDGSYGWTYYLETFGLKDWRVFSSGDLEGALTYLQTHGRDVDLVVVDEAHRFRNPETKAYALLKAIVAGRKVLLLTATPFNNRPLDVYALLSLFITPGASALPPYRDLHAYFVGGSRSKGLDGRFRDLSYILRYNKSPRPKARKRAERFYREHFGEDPPVDEARVRRAQMEIARRVRAAMAPVTVRRNRLDLLKDPRYRAEAPNFPRVSDPAPLFYGLEAEQEKFYDRVIGEWFGAEGKFFGALYRPEWFKRRVEEDDLEDLDLPVKTFFTLESQRNLAEHMRRLLVRRFESSFAAFSKTLRRMAERYEKALRVAREGGVFYLDKDLLDRAAEGEEELLLEEVLEGGVYRKEDFPEGGWELFLRALEEDLSLLKQVNDEVARLQLADPGVDPKIGALAGFLRDSLQNEPKRKVVVFTEFADTAETLYQGLKDRGFRVYWPGRNPGKREMDTVVHNFDASLLLRGEPHQDDYDVLVVTDKFSEGVNLNRAGTVVNYDIPWNPVRLIQRIGRVNRVGYTPFPEIRVYHFFPTAKGAKVVDPAKVAQEKLFLIHKALGEDSKVLREDEEPTPARLYERLTTNPEEEVSFDTWILEEWERLKAEVPDLEERVGDLPNRVKTGRALREGEGPFTLAVAQKGLAFFGLLLRDGEKDPVPLPFEEALNLFRIPPEEPRVEPDGAFWEAYGRLEGWLARGGEGYAWPSNSTEQRLLNALPGLIHRQDLPEEDREFLRRIQADLRGGKRLPRIFLRRLVAAFPDENPRDGVYNLEDLKGFLDVLRKGRHRYGHILLKEIEAPSPDLVVALRAR